MTNSTSAIFSLITVAVIGAALWAFTPKIAPPTRIVLRVDTVYAETPATLAAPAPGCLLESVPWARVWGAELKWYVRRGQHRVDTVDVHDAWIPMTLAARARVEELWMASERTRRQHGVTWDYDSAAAE